MKSHLRCLRCQNVAVIQRPRWRKREKGHIKTMWCWRCKRVTQHQEGA